MFPKVYVICDNACKYESMTKEQILTAITQAVENGEIGDVDAGFITTIKSYGTEKGLSFWYGTEAEFNTLSPATTSFIARVDKDGRVYICKDDTVVHKLLELADKMADGETARDYIGSAFTFTREVVVPLSSWEKNGDVYNAVVEVAGVVDADTPFLDVALSGTNLEADEKCINSFGAVYMAKATDNAITLYAIDEPTDTFTLIVKVVR